ncbi:MAG TPA: alpha/beta fold hydrolase [Rubrivivax sp.]|nr:alpha/beta fold hydrolase [Rubrivivax sp.]
MTRKPVDVLRRALLLVAIALPAACGNTPPPAASALPPIVFVHGNGDTAALWTTTIWRFESNGWPRDRLHAIDLPYPLARDDDAVAQAGRTSSTEHMQFLAAEVEKVMRNTGARQVVLVGNSRGGNAIRNYVAKGGGAGKVSHAVLGGTPNHGVWADPSILPGNEFNGAGRFLTALNNQGAAGVEITPGPRWMTIRSVDNDLYAQPMGLWIGRPTVATNVTAAGPELRGAHNVVLPGIDHRETSYSPQAFAATYQFITGKAAQRTTIEAEARVVLDGKITGQGLDNNPASGAFSNNLPLAGASIEVYAVDAATGQRSGPPSWRKTVGADGRWGPFTAVAGTPYEFVITAPGYSTTHIYRSPFPRSSDIVHMRAERLTEADKAAGSVVILRRPRGYFGVPRDTIIFDGQNPAPGIRPGVAGVSSSTLRLATSLERAVPAQFNEERIVGRNWPAAQDRIVLLELHY